MEKLGRLEGSLLWKEIKVFYGFSRNRFLAQRLGAVKNIVVEVLTRQRRLLDYRVKPDNDRRGAKLRNTKLTPSPSLLIHVIHLIR